MSMGQTLATHEVEVGRAKTAAGGDVSLILRTEHLMPRTSRAGRASQSCRSQ